MIKPWPDLSIRRQCELVGISRSGLYSEPCPQSEENLALMRRLTVILRREGWEANRKRVTWPMQVTGMEALYPKRWLSLGWRGN